MRKALLAVLAALIVLPQASQAKKPPQTTVTNTYVTNTTVTTINPTAVVVTEKNVFGPKLDMPNLVHVYGDWYIGAEGGKDVAYTNVSRGWFGYAKVTYAGTLLDFDKKRQ